MQIRMPSGRDPFALVMLVFALALAGCRSNLVDGSRFACDPLEPDTCGEGWTCLPTEARGGTSSYAGVCVRNAALEDLPDSGIPGGDAEETACPRIETSPSGILDLGYVAEGASRIDSFVISNLGLAALHVTSVSFAGAAGFSVQWPGARKDGSSVTEWLPFTAEGRTMGSDTCEEIRVPANSSSSPIQVKYQAAAPGEAVATMTLFSDDPRFDASQGRGLVLELRANFGGPCLRVLPSPLDFGTVLIGSAMPGKTVGAILESCGDQDVQVFSIALGERSNADFQPPDLRPLSTFDETHPLTLAPGVRSETFLLTYLPLSVETDAIGHVVPDTCTLVVKNSSPVPLLTVPMKGLGVQASCAVCEFTIRDGQSGHLVEDCDSIRPMTGTRLLYLQDRSYDPSSAQGGIARHLWSVSQPAGSAATFDPNPLFASPTFQPNVVGEYTFTLKVENNQGCTDTCSKRVFVHPPQGCIVELTWDTPTDPDESDTCSPPGPACGSDMDLHVAHPMASSPELDSTGQPFGYFDEAYDCYWMNAHPVWNADHSADPLYQPSLDRDDCDGAGPEIFSYTIPEDGRCYRVGVHYFDDHGYGRSYPTLRVFVNDSTLLYEKTLSKGMKMLDLWDVGRVCCTGTQQPFVEFRTAAQEPVVVPNYVSPF